MINPWDIPPHSQRSQTPGHGSTSRAVTHLPATRHSRASRAHSFRNSLRYVAAFPFALVAGVLACLLWLLAGPTQWLADLACRIMPPERREPIAPGLAALLSEAGNQLPRSIVEGDDSNVIPFHAAVDMSARRRPSPGIGKLVTAHQQPASRDDFTGGAA